MDKTNENLISEGSEEFWKNHILAALAFSGTNGKYCKLNGLDHRVFSYNKRRLGYGRPRRSKKAFIEVHPKLVDVEKVTIRTEPKKVLPDAKWLAEFARSLLANQLV